MKIDIPAISILIPMYNAEKYIGDCLDTIWAQTFDDYEVIIVDDVSTDKSRDIVTSYLSRFNRGGRKTAAYLLGKKFGACRRAA